MKKITWILGTILLVSALILAGCSTSTTSTPTSTSTTSSSTQQPQVNVTEGTLTGVNTQNPSITVQTQQGSQTFPISPNTGLSIGGTSCTIGQLADLQAAGGDYNCSVVYDDDGNVVGVAVTNVPPPASVSGTISDVNIKDSTITVKTASGDKVYDVDPNTGLLIGGVACSLDLINAIVDSGAQLPCTVIYSTDAQGNALYIDVANPPNLTQGTGTITDVNVDKSTITIMTDKGPRTVEINAKTGQFLNGDVCSLQQIDEAATQGDTLVTCQVMYYADKDGNIVYVDISTQPK
jgi:hypothetical protein